MWKQHTTTKTNVWKQQTNKTHWVEIKDVKIENQNID
jgi:hypothetical protein